MSGCKLRDLPVICPPLGNGISNPIATDTVAAILQAVLPCGDRERAFEECVEGVYLLLRNGEGKRGKAIDLVRGLGEVAHDDVSQSSSSKCGDVNAETSADQCCKVMKLVFITTSGERTYGLTLAPSGPSR